MGWWFQNYVTTLKTFHLTHLTSAQNCINTLANCNHDEDDRIWNQIVYRLQSWRKIRFIPSPFRVTIEKVAANLALEGSIGSVVLLVTLKGLDGNLIFPQICSFSTIWFHILSSSSLLQFARVLILFWAPVRFEYLQSL